MVFNERVSSRTSTMGFLLAAIIAIMVFPGWAWSQGRDDGTDVTDESSAALEPTPEPFTDPESPAPEIPARPGATETAPAARLPAATPLPETTSAATEPRAAPALEGASETSARPPGEAQHRGRKMLGLPAHERGRLSRNEPATEANGGDDVIQEIPVAGSPSKVRIRTTPQGVVIVELDEGQGRVRSLGPFTSIGTTPPGWLWDATSRRFVSRFDGKPATGQFLADAQDNSGQRPGPKQAQPGLSPGAHREVDNAAGSGPMVHLFGANKNAPAAGIGRGLPTTIAKPSPPGAAPGRQILLVELAKIDLEEKTIELEAVRDDLAANPGDVKLQRKLKLAALAVRRAEIQLGLAEKSGQHAENAGF